MKILLHKQEDMFLPFDAEAVEYAKKVKKNDVLVCDIKRARNPKFHSYAFKALHILHDMVDETMEFDPWRRLLTVKAGYFTAIGKVSINGDVTSVLVPDSLSFESMDEDTFHSCLNGLLQAFIDKYGKQITYDQLTEWSQINT